MKGNYEWSAMWQNRGCTVPVRHPHDHTVYARGARLVDDGFEGRDQHLAALQTKTLLRRPLPGQEVLKPGRQNTCGYMAWWSSRPPKSLARSYTMKWLISPPSATEEDVLLSIIQFSQQYANWSRDRSPIWIVLRKFIGCHYRIISEVICYRR